MVLQWCFVVEAQTVDWFDLTDKKQLKKKDLSGCSYGFQVYVWLFQYIFHN